MSNHKMKGLLKGLRYISQMFENEKEADMQIGFPTDVKHVAHIGWDGPSVNSPSWMNEFKAAPGFQSQPLGDPGEIKDESEIQWVSEDSTRRRNQNGLGKEAQEVPKSSRRNASTGSSTENQNGEKTEKSKSRRSSKSHRQPKESSHVGEPSTKLPDLPKKSRRKKSKDSGDGGSSRSSRSRRANASKSSDTVPEESGSVSKSNEQELAQAPGLNSSEVEIY